jgi:hypothetical protein
MKLAITPIPISLKIMVEEHGSIANFHIHLPKCRI